MQHFNEGLSAVVTYGAYDFKFALIVHVFEQSIHVYEDLDLQN